MDVRPTGWWNQGEEILMSASITAIPAGQRVSSSTTSAVTTAAFWELLWRTSGVQFVGLFIIASAIYGSQPPVGASSDALAAFYDGERTRILIAAAFSGLNLLNLLWFAAALQDHPGGCGAGRLGRSGNRRQRGVRSAVSSCRSPWARRSRTRSPAPEMTRSHRD